MQKIPGTSWYKTYDVVLLFLNPGGEQLVSIEEKCEQCYGLGHAELLCSMCNGSGEGRSDGSQCTQCDGMGTCMVYCPRCEGKGAADDCQRDEVT